MGGLAVPGPLGNTALAQFILLHLTAFSRRQLAHEFEISRNREIGQARFAKRNQLGFRELLAWMKDDGRHDFIFGKRRTDGKCRCIRDGRVAEQDLLDFEGRDILTTAPDGVLEAIDKPKIAVGLAYDSIPGVEPEIAPRFGGFLRSAEISGCEREWIIRPHHEFAWRIVCDVIALTPDHAGLETFEHCAQQSWLLVLDGRTQYEIGFRGSPAVEQADPRALRKLPVELSRDPGRERDANRMRGLLRRARPREQDRHHSAQQIGNGRPMQCERSKESRRGKSLLETNGR